MIFHLGLDLYLDIDLDLYLVFLNLISECLNDGITSPNGRRST